MGNHENARDAVKIVNALASEAIRILVLGDFSAEKMACVASGFHLAVITIFAKKLKDSGAPDELIIGMRKGILERTIFTSRIALEDMGHKMAEDETIVPVPNQPSVIRHVVCELESLHDDVEVDIKMEKDIPFAVLAVRIANKGGVAQISTLQIALDAIARCLSGPDAAKMIDNGRTK